MPTLTEVLTDAAGELYALEPAGFVPARDARAAALRADGQEEAAARVKALRKPSTAAWVVNLLARAEGEQVEQVVELGAAFREAQDDLDGPRLRELTRQRRQLVAAVAARARSLAVETGASVSGAVLAQVESTLTAAMIDADAGRAVRSGLLVGPLQATGIGRADVASAVAVPDALGIAPVDDDGAPGRHLHAVPDPPGVRGGHRRAASSRGQDDAAARAEEEAAREAARREAEQELADAEDDVAAARDVGSAAAAEVGRIEGIARRTDAERDAVRRRLAELDDEAAAVDAELRGAVVARQRAERTLTDATRRRDEAAARLRDR
ncbi:hypothetical protein [Krasilnikoviella flava]|uniref:Uncharacterized protein n=1 Tax=Krasilnikoviella flava TaxID=526729 RepID=A0A1T5LYZ2_9MICO|nr:hypothetical protein [Krasilnikoviella flava]SKC81197.1 hypothetical protein SAMN04324258_4180 [Krasilnikoviella flava]